MLKRKTVSMKHNSKIRGTLVGKVEVCYWKSKGHPIFGVVSLPPKDWPCNCINTPAPGAASTAASTSPIRIERKHTHTEQRYNLHVYFLK